MNRAYSFANIVEFSRSERETRHRRKEVLCHFYVRLFAGFLLAVALYIAFGYIGKWMWYYNDESLVDYGIADWEQVVGTLMGVYICFFTWWCVVKYCPVCGKYSSYGRRSKEQRVFWCYQLELVAGIICFAGLVKLVELVFEG